MRCKTLLSLSFLGSLSFAGCGVSGKVAGTTPPPTPAITSVSVSCAAASLPTRTNQPVLSNGRREPAAYSSGRDVVRSLGNRLKLRPLYRPIRCAYVRFR